MVECIQEIGTKLQALRLAEEEVLLQTQIQVHIVRPDDRALRGAGAKGPGRLRCECVICIRNPLELITRSGVYNLVGVLDRTIAVRTSGTGSGTVIACEGPRVVGSVDGQGESGVIGKYWINRPVSNHRICCRRQIMAEGFSSSYGQFVKKVAAHDLAGIIVATRPIRFRIVEVLVIGERTRGLGIRTVGSIVTTIIGHALSPGVGKLALQSSAGALLQHGL